MNTLEESLVTMLHTLFCTHEHPDECMFYLECVCEHPWSEPCHSKWLAYSNNLIKDLSVAKDDLYRALLDACRIRRGASEVTLKLLTYSIIGLPKAIVSLPEDPPPDET